MISFNEFCTKTVGVIREQLNYASEVELEEFYKINTNYMGLVIRKKGINISPAINLNYLYSEYENGACYSDIIQKIHDIYNNTKLENEINLNFLKDFENVKDLIVFRLVNYDINKEMLKSKVHRKFMDMALLYYYEFDLHEIEHCSICISTSQMQAWNVTEEMLYCLAMKNTPMIHQPYWFDLQDYLKSIMSSEAINMMGIACYECRMFVITNIQKNYGASTIVCTDTLKNISDEVDDDLYVIPSSVHEFIAIPSKCIPNNYNYNELIRNINLEYLAPDEVLSDTLYYYDAKEAYLKIYTKISSIG